MPFFTDTNEAEKYIGQVFEIAINDPVVGPKLRDAGVTLAINMINPEGKIFVDYAAGQVLRGATDRTADVELFGEADISHRFWLGQVNVATALARGQLRAKGPVTKILKIIPLAKPIFPQYEAALRADGRDDLADVEAQ